MAKGLFESPKKALLFVGMTMLSVVMLVGTEDDEGALVKAAATLDQDTPEFRGHDDKFATSLQHNNSFTNDAEPAEFTSDEDLIDSAEGFDPTPDDVEPYEPETDLGASETQVVRIEPGDRPEVGF